MSTLDEAGDHHIREGDGQEVLLFSARLTAREHSLLDVLACRHREHKLRRGFVDDLGHVELLVLSSTGCCRRWAEPGGMLVDRPGEGKKLDPVLVFVVSALPGN